VNKPGPAAIEHITITSGAVRMSARTEVRPEIKAKVGRLLRKGGVLWDGWSVEVRAIEAIEGGPPGPAGWVFDAHHGGIRVVRCWICRLEEASAQLWEEASGHAEDPRVVLHRPRGAPWLAAWLDPEHLEALMSTPMVLMQAGDLERCVAWALLDSEP
jgi:hypothetical protein